MLAGSSATVKIDLARFVCRAANSNCLAEAGAEAARCMAVEERYKNGTSIPSYRLKLRQERKPPKCSNFLMRVMGGLLMVIYLLF